jgi:Acyl-CoA thioesterase C-terminal domain/Acyl-CoA thioesterase N-terminal domain
VIEQGAFFTSDRDGRMVPNESAHSPWGQDMLHGRLLAALAAREAESMGAGFVPTRLTIDLFRAAPMDPVEIRCEIVRDGRRVRVAHVALRCGSREVGRGSVMMLRPGAQPPGEVWQPDPWAAPAPEVLGKLSPDPAERSSIDIRPINEGGLAGAAQKRLWIREAQSLVSGEELSPFVRAVAAADLANPFGNFGEQGLAFINSDLTVYLGRTPVGEWIGLDIVSRTSTGGVSVVAGNLHDVDGMVGHCAVGSVATAAMGDSARTDA